jgi:hypothetical protein
VDRANHPAVEFGRRPDRSVESPFNARFNGCVVVHGRTYGAEVKSLPEDCHG